MKHTPGPWDVSDTSWLDSHFAIDAVSWGAI